MSTNANIRYFIAGFLAALIVLYLYLTSPQPPKPKRAHRSRPTSNIVPLDLAS